MKNMQFLLIVLVSLFFQQQCLCAWSGLTMVANARNPASLTSVYTDPSTGTVHVIYSTETYPRSLCYFRVHSNMSTSAENCFSRPNVEFLFGQIVGASDGSSLYAVFNVRVGNLNDVYYTYSKDSGATWGNMLAISKMSGTESWWRGLPASHVYLERTKRTYLFYVMRDGSSDPGLEYRIVQTTRPPGSLNFGVETAVFASRNLTVRNVAACSSVESGNVALYVFWLMGEKSSNEFAVYFVKSTSNGIYWTAPSRVRTGVYPRAESVRFQEVLAAGALFLQYPLSNSFRQYTYGALQISRDGGRSWTNATALGRQNRTQAYFPFAPIISMSACRTRAGLTLFSLNSQTENYADISMTDTDTGRTTWETDNPLSGVVGMRGGLISCASTRNGTRTQVSVVISIQGAIYLAGTVLN